MTRIKTWFHSVSGLSAEAIFPNVQAILTTGWFVSKPASHPSGKSLAAFAIAYEDGDQAKKNGFF